MKHQWIHKNCMLQSKVAERTLEFMIQRYNMFQEIVPTIEKWEIQSVLNCQNKISVNNPWKTKLAYNLIAL